MRSSFFAALGLSVSLAQCSPVVPSLEVRQNIFCAVVNMAVDGFNQEDSASAYCSSVLSITAAPTPTSTPKIGSVVTVTKYATVYSGAAKFPEGGKCFQDPPSKKRRAITVEPVVPASPTPTAPTNLPRHYYGAAPVPKPACFDGYQMTPVISAACSCLSLTTPAPTAAAPPAISTKTITSTLTVRPDSASFKIRNANTGLFARLADTSVYNLAFSCDTPAVADEFYLDNNCNVIHRGSNQPLWIDAGAGGGRVLRWSGLPGASYSKLLGRIVIDNGDFKTGQITFTDANSRRSLFHAARPGSPWSEVFSQADKSYVYFPMVAMVI
ncbi:hypothetical protein Micbo1qcDRAFT_227186 [Microdochium bolleyi]|uniref:Cyanovirin-N domain-containing protein n=1 Tax=Microdochium bolleyi TaxID=196109 RepID=A0A136IYU5_9PEZI|nr:hypothetical protein Micbo1qcDRAFT_227186 [Microdochium bolleyi]